MNEIRAVDSKRFFAIGFPITDHVFRGLRYTKKLKPKPQQPLGFQILDDRVRHCSGVLKRDRLPPGADGTAHSCGHRLKVNLLDHPAPPFCDLTFEPEKVVSGPSLHCIFFFTGLENHALGVSELHNLAARNERAKKRGIQAELPRKLAFEDIHVMNIGRGLTIGRALSERSDKLLRRAFHPKHLSF